MHMVWRANPNATATCAQPLPASSIWSVLTRFLSASHKPGFAMPALANIATGDKTVEVVDGCHELRECQ